MGFGCTLSEDLLRIVDERRGLVPRTKFIEALVASALNVDELKNEETDEAEIVE